MGGLLGGIGDMGTNALLLPFELAAMPFTGQPPGLIQAQWGILDRYEGWVARHESEGRDSVAAHIGAALNTAGDMTGVNSLASGISGHDLMTGAQLSTAEANAQIGLGIVGVTTTVAGKPA